MNQVPVPNIMVLTDESDDLLASLGVTLPAKAAKPPVECGQKPPKAKPVRFTEWSNAHTFEFGGYLARVVRHTCGTCEGHTDVLEGIFIEEVHQPSGTRRLQQMAKGAQWPAVGEHRFEVHETEVDFCAKCVGALGFSRVVDGKGQPYGLVLKEVDGTAVGSANLLGAAK